MKFLSFLRSFTKFEICLWLGSVLLVGASFVLSSEDPVSLAASLVGITALILIATIVSLLYAHHVAKQMPPEERDPTQETK